MQQLHRSKARLIDEIKLSELVEDNRQEKSPRCYGSPPATHLYNHSLPSPPQPNTPCDCLPLSNQSATGPPNAKHAFTHTSASSAAHNNTPYTLVESVPTPAQHTTSNWLSAGLGGDPPPRCEWASTRTYWCTPPKGCLSVKAIFNIHAASQVSAYFTYVAAWVMKIYWRRMPCRFSHGLTRMSRSFSSHFCSCSLKTIN